MSAVRLLVIFVLVCSAGVFWWTQSPEPAPEESAAQSCSSCDNRKKNLGKLREALRKADDGGAE